MRLAQAFQARLLRALRRAERIFEAFPATLLSWEHAAFSMHVGARTLFIEPGSPWENGFQESFHGKLRDGLFDGEIFCPLKQAQVLIERWRWEYNHLRPHGSLGCRAPAPEAWLSRDQPLRATS